MKFGSSAAAWLSACAFVCLSCSQRPSDVSDAAEQDASSSSVGAQGLCNVDAECNPGQRCAAVVPERSLLMPFMCPNQGLVTCSADTSCGTGSVCEPSKLEYQGAAASLCPRIESVCTALCSKDGSTGRTCAESDRCNPNGHCERIRCDESDFVGCPGPMLCDLAYIWDADPTVPLGKYTPYGTSGGTVQEGLAAEAGCVFRQCDDPQAYQCLTGLRCDPQAAEPSKTGCVDIPCAEFGHCSSDEYYICTPTSAERHSATLDAHGCAYRNCEERPCSVGYTCDFDSPLGDEAGCRRTLCSEPTGEPCDENMKCTPEDPTASVTGCTPRQCDTDGFDCGASNMVCAPDSASRNQFGCISNPAPPLPSSSAAVTSSSAGAVNSVAPPGPNAGNVVPPGSTSSPPGASAASSSSAGAPRPSASTGIFLGVCR
jgi:hypothetical protein